MMIWNVWVRGVLLVLFHWIMLDSAQGQDASAPSAAALIYTEIEEQLEWEFGVEVESAGAATGIEVTCPVPVNWPEQDVEYLNEQKTGNISSVSFRDFPGDVRLMLVRIARMGPGETARATVKIRLKKRNILPPRETATLMIPKSVEPKLKSFLTESPYIEIKHKSVQALAASIELDSSLSDWQKVELIYDTIRERFPYEFDTTIRSCPEAIEAGKGDCEELSSLFIAVCRIKKIPARAVWIPSHTYPEFYLVDSNGEGTWFPCQLAGSRQFGQMLEERPVLQKGDKFKLPGNSKPTRYVQPTLTANNATAGLGLKWIAQKVGGSPDLDREN